MTQLLIDRTTLEQALDAFELILRNLASGGGSKSINKLVARENAEFTKKLRAALAGVEPIGWQAIETAPKDGTSVLAYTHDGYKYPLVCACTFDCGLWWPDSWESTDDPLSPTHWMPLPAAPKEQQ